MKTSVLSASMIAGSALLATAAAAADESPSGITLYGIMDMGVAYQNHGTALSDYYTGLAYVLQKNSNKSVFSLAPGGLGQSRVGVKGSETLTDEFSGIFRLEAAINPWDGSLANSSKILIQNNGLTPLQERGTVADGNRNGQAFAQAAYFGVSSQHFGTMTLGRQTSLLLDDIVAYDPQAGAYAFSVIGFSGVTGGAGDTQDARMDQTVKYTFTSGMVHGGAFYQFNGVGNHPDGAHEFSLGMDLGPLSADVVYSRVKDAISEASLSAAQVPIEPSGTLAATVSDNTAYTANLKYTISAATLFAGYEHIEYANPSAPLSAGVTDPGGYSLSVLNNSAYTIHKILQVYWTGLKYQFSPNLSMTGAYYRYSQNSYKGNGCSNDSFGSCSGSLDAFSISIDQRLSKRFDVYAGAMRTSVTDGLASGYLQTNSVDPMVGMRFIF